MHTGVRSARSGQRLWSVAAIASVVFLAAACGGGSGTKTATATTTIPPSTSTTRPGAGAFRVYQQCLAAHGVTRSSTTVAGAATTTIDPTVMAAAQQACAALRPAGGAGFGGGGGGLNGPQAAAYRTCLQQHGVTLPAAGQGTPPSSIDRTNPAFAAAAQACASLRPARGATTSTTA